MKKVTKFGLIGGSLLISAIALSGCTASFCSTLDKAHMMYAFDYGVTAYYTEDTKPAEATQVYVGGNPLKVVVDNVEVNLYKYSDFDNCPALNAILKNAGKQSNPIETPSLNYFATFDQKVLEYVYASYGTDLPEITIDESSGVNLLNILVDRGYYKFYYNESTTEEISYTHTGVRWANWEYFNNQVRNDTSVPIDQLAKSDFVAFYKSKMLSYINSYRSCIATSDGKYGYYGAAGHKTPIDIEGKTYGYAWSRGFFEGLLIWPIAALADVVTNGFLGAGVATGVASLLAIIVVTLIVRGILLSVTFNQSANQAKMTALQPEISKIQAKYPNANKDRNEQARLADATQKLYKKHGVHPLRSILTMIIQFPVFICVWGGLQGSAALSTGSFLGLNLSDSISSVLFNGANWANGSAWTALVLFLLMAGAQAVSMLLPQHLQKKKAKAAPKLGKNPTADQNSKRMKWFTYIMLAMIIFMGFSLASGMGVYWFISAIFSLAQTMITQAVMNRKKAK